jgi:hypothetical protein
MKVERKQIEKKLTNWWNQGDQKNPCLLITIPPEKSKLLETDDLYQFWNDIDFRINRSITVAKESLNFGQSIPYHWLDYQESSMCLALGCEPAYIDKESVWAYPVYETLDPIKDIKLDYDNFAYRTMRDMNSKLSKIIPTDEPIAFFALGGITDIVSGLYGVENFLIDMIQKPEEIKIAMEHIKRVWIEAFSDYKKVLYENRRTDNGISWAGIWAPGTTFPLQEDLTYMISNSMFKEFCIPHIRDIASVVDYPLYHLDGVGAIQHLEDLLDVDEIRAIQWVPGAGKERIGQWYDLINRVKDSGKSIQVFAEPDEVPDLVSAVGPDRLLISVKNCTFHDAEKLMETYGD